MKIEITKKRPVSDLDTKINLVITKDAISFVDMKVENEVEIEQIVKLIEEVANTNENCVIRIREEQI